jgi:hypothetical protein
MTSPRDARRAYALLKVKQKQISNALDEIAVYVDQDPGDRNSAKLGEAKLGTVFMTAPEAKARVADRDAFTKWVSATRQTEIVEAVRASYETALLGDITKRGDVVDENGEVVPGVEFSSATPQQRFIPADGAEDLLTVIEPRDLPEIEGIDLAGLLGIPAGGEE